MVHLMGMLPIRKVDFDTVSLTSYYGKLFVTRSSKRVNDYGTWLRNTIMSKGLDNTDTDVKNLQPANVFDHTFHCPRLYSTIAMGIKGFTAIGYHFIFDCQERLKVFSEKDIKEYEVNDSVLVGISDKKTLLVLNKDNIFEEVTNTGLIAKGNIENILSLNEFDAPVDFCEVKIFAKTIPLGVVLAYLMGFDKMLDFLRVSPRRVNAGQRLNLESHEYALVFNDETLIFSRDDTLASLVIAGFNEYSRAIKNYSVYLFDKKAVYLSVLENSGVQARFMREIDLLDELFIDPITRELLIQMNEPTIFKGLLVGAVKMLTHDSHPNALDMKYMRIKGYERLAGAVYTELVRSIRVHNSSMGKGNSPIELHPYAVWKRIVQDPSINMCSDINPIEDLKSKEAVTYSGEGGRTSQSMSTKTRLYHPSDMGVISEATMDSGDVAINTFTSADPQFNSLRGTTNPYELGKTGATALLSTSALLAPGSDHDDPKRVNLKTD